MVALVTGFVCHHRRAKHLLRHDLTSAPGRQALTTSPYATTALVFAAIASTASLPLVRDDRETPLWWDRMAGVIKMICPTGQQEYFFAQGWTYILG